MEVRTSSLSSMHAFTYPYVSYILLCWLLPFYLHTQLRQHICRIKSYTANLRRCIFNGLRRSAMLLVFHLEVGVIHLVMLAFKTL